MPMLTQRGGEGIAPIYSQPSTKKYLNNKDGGEMKYGGLTMAGEPEYVEK